MRKLRKLRISKEYVRGINSVFDVFLTSPQNKQIDHVPKTLIDDYKNLNDDYKKSVSSRNSLVYGK